MADYIQEIAALVAPHLPVTEAEAAELIAVPPDPELGDYAIPCHKFAKELKKAPVAIASELVANVTAEPLPERILSVQAAGPFVNITLDPVRRARTVLHAAREAGAAYGGGDEGVGKTLVMDYSHPNIAKPFGIGHLRSTVIGAAIYRLHRALGWKTVGVNHLGDWGTQFGKLITAYKKWGQGEPREQTIEQLYDMYVRFHKAAEDDPALDDEGRAWHKRMEDGDPEALALWEGFREASLTEFKRIYARLKVDFDSWNGESFYRDKVAPALQLAIDKGVAKEDDGAWIVDLKEDQLGVWLLRKSDGATLYATRDLAAAIYRAETYRFDRLLYVVGATTTSDSMSNLFWTVLRDPEMLDRARADADLRARIVHELLRWEPPVALLPRVATHGGEIGGVTIPAGGMLLCGIASANRDEAVFAEPDRFDPDREQGELLTFGFGNKFCPGSHMARQQLEAALGVVLERLPNLRLVAADPPSGAILRRTERLEVAWG